MVYTIIAEPRSGGTSLMNWIEKSLPNYVIAQEPYFIGNDFWVKGEDTTNIDWIDKYENLFIREIFREDRNVDELSKRSDKVLCLYRENWYDQVKSILYQEMTNVEGYMVSYQNDDVNQMVVEELIIERYNFFKKTKNKIQEWSKLNNVLSVSYEDLYYGDGIKIIKEYFGFESDINFPLNKRHLKDNEGNGIVPNTPPPTPIPTVTPTPTPPPPIERRPLI